MRQNFFLKLKIKRHFPEKFESKFKKENLNEINRKRTNSTKKPEQNTTTNKSTPNSVPTKGSAIIIGDYMVKHLADPRTSKKNRVKIKKSPGATTEDIIDNYQVFGRNRIFLLLHSRTNYLKMG